MGSDFNFLSISAQNLETQKSWLSFVHFVYKQYIVSNHQNQIDRENIKKTNKLYEKIRTLYLCEQ